MADFNSETPRQSAYSATHNSPTLQRPAPGTLEPMHLSHDWRSDSHSYRSYLPTESPYPSHSPNVYGSPYPPLYQPHQPPGYGSPQNAGFWDSSTSMHRPHLPLPFRHSGYTQDSLSADFAGFHTMNGNRPTSLGQQPPMLRHVMQNPPPPNFTTRRNAPHGYPHHMDPNMPAAAPRTPDSNGPNTTDTPPTRTDPAGPQFAYQATSPGYSYQRLQLPNPQAAGVPGRIRPHVIYHGARPQLSPRTSHRRSFDRYSTDLSHPNGNSVSDDASHAPIHRSRRPRTMVNHRPPISGFYARQLAHYHPNVPSDFQLQNLKDGLKKHVRSSLAEGVSPSCDICQKDYSETVVKPTEDEEMAVELSCKHVFGEYCMHTWVGRSGVTVHACSLTQYI